MSHVVVIGSLNMDLVVRTPRMPVPGETVLGRDFQTIPGGKGANQAVGAARLGAHVSMVGRVGADAFGEALCADLQASGIDTTHVLTDSKAPSGVALITLDENGQNSIVVASGANMYLTPADVRAAFVNIGKIDVVILQLESPLACVLEAARQGNDRGAKIVLNPSPAQPVPCNDEVLLAASGSALITPSDFQVDANLGFATLNATVTLTDSLSGSSFEVTVDLNWTATSSRGHQNSHINFSFQGCHINSHVNAAFRLAEAVGAISNGTTNFTPDPSLAGNLFSAKSGDISHGC